MAGPVHSPRKTCWSVVGATEAHADAPKVVWALDFQFDSTIDGKAVEDRLDGRRAHPRVAAEPGGALDYRRAARRRARELFTAAGGPPMVLRMDNGPEFISQALQQFCAGKVGLSYIPPGTPWNNGHIESFNNRLRRSASTATTGPTCSKPGWSSATSNTSTITASSLGAGLPDPGRVRCPMQPHPSPRGLRDQLNRYQTQPGSKTGWTDYRGPVKTDRPKHGRSLF